MKKSCLGNIDCLIDCFSCCLFWFGCFVIVVFFSFLQNPVLSHFNGSTDLMPVVYFAHV